MVSVKERVKERIKNFVEFLEHPQRNSIVDVGKMYNDVVYLELHEVYKKGVKTRERLYKIRQELENVKFENEVLKNEIIEIIKQAEGLMNDIVEFLKILNNYVIERDFTKIQEQKFVDQIQKFVDQIRDLYNKGSGIADTLSLTLSFRGREANEILDEIHSVLKNMDAVRKDNKRPSLINLHRKLNEFINKFTNLHKAGLPDVVLDYEEPIQQLLDEVEGPEVELYTGELIGILTGIGMRDYTLDTIKYHFEECSDKSSNDAPLYRYVPLYRYPPLEPLHEEWDGVKGRCVWIPEELLERSHDGKSLSMRWNVFPVDLLKREPIIVKVPLEGLTVWIKYGSEKLTYLYKRYRNNYRNNIEKFREELKELQTQYPRHYKVNNLTYVWYCTIGYGMSTDPYNYKQCPLENECPIGIRKSKGRSRDKCRYWSRSRKLFPRVYINPIINLRIQNKGEPLGFFKVIYGKKVKVYVKYSRLQWYMPSAIYSEGVAVRYDLKEPVLTSTLNTNVIGIELPYSLLEGLIHDLFIVKSKPKVNVTTTKNVTLDTLILSKYFIYEKSNGGTNKFKVYESDIDRLTSKYEEFRKGISGAKLNEVIEYAIEMFAHTLAHMFYSFTLYHLGLKPRNLLYYYKVDKQENKVLVVVIENNPYGSLDLIEHVKRVSDNNVVNFVEKFLKDTVEFLNNHEQDVIRYGESVPTTTTDATVQKLNDMYNKLLDKGLVLDHHDFTLFLVLSGLLDKSKIENDKYIHQVPILPCIDGCNSCIMLNDTCNDLLIQNIGLSRNLVKWVLDILLGNHNFYGTGRNSGAALLKSTEEVLVAISPYLDDDGLSLLKELSDKGVKIYLVTSKETYEKYKERIINIANDKLEIRIPERHIHFKNYIIDNRVMVSTSWNLSGFKSLNEFRLKILKEKKEGVSFYEQYCE